MQRPWLDILLDKMKKSYKDSKILEIDENILCLHTQTKNYSDDEFGRFNGAYTFDSLYFVDLECTQENANKVIEKFCPIALGRDNYRLIKINGLTMLVPRDDKRLNKPHVISFKYIRNEQSGCRITCDIQRLNDFPTHFKCDPTHFKYEYLGQNYIPEITKKELQKLLYNHRKHKLNTELWIVNCYMFPPVICNDGFEVSAQANINYSCEPREELAYWESMELCFPSQEEPLLNDYLSGWKRPLKDPYGCVPIQVIVDVINKHGGMKNIEDFRSE